MSKHLATDYWLPIIENYAAGNSALPLKLGLSDPDFHHLLGELGIENPPIEPEVESNLQLRHELLNMRQPEFNELKALLLDSLNTEVPFGEEMAHTLACACMGSQHLWHDLGMPERPRLTALFGDYFPPLRAKNFNNMRWKRFLYRQLCENGGDFICRSPSCEQCSSYSECFNLEN